MAESEHSKNKETAQKRSGEQVSELETQLTQLTEEMKEKERSSKQRDDESFRRAHELEKLNALLE